MKNLIVAAALLIASCGLTPAMAQGPSCTTMQMIVDAQRAHNPNLKVEEVRAFTGHDADKVADAVDKVVPDDIDYDGMTTLSVNAVEIGDIKLTVIVFLKDNCVLSLVRTDWETYQQALKIAFGPRA